MSTGRNGESKNYSPQSQTFKKFTKHPPPLPPVKKHSVLLLVPVMSREQLSVLLLVPVMSREKLSVLLLVPVMSREKLSVLLLVPVMSREGVFKILNWLGRDYGLIQVAPDSHGPSSQVLTVRTTSWTKCSVTHTHTHIKSHEKKSSQYSIYCRLAEDLYTSSTISTRTIQLWKSSWLTYEDYVVWGVYEKLPMCPDLCPF